MGTEQLVGTIQKVETHEPDPTTEEATDPWDRVGSEFSDLREKLKQTYRQAADETGPTETEVKDAFATISSAWSQVASSVASALKDPDVRDQLRQAASSFASALSTTISGLGSELKGEPNVSEEE